MTAVWLEEWRPEGARIFLRITLDGGFGLAPVGYFRFDDKSFYGDMERTRLAAAAPSLVWALLAVEFGGYLRGFTKDPGAGDGPCCSICSARPGERHCSAVELRCEVDEALVAAGLPDQASRDEARAAIAARVAR